MQRIGWCVAIKVGKLFQSIPSTCFTSRKQAIDYYMDSKEYKELKRRGRIKTVAVYAKCSDLK